MGSLSKIIAAMEMRFPVFLLSSKHGEKEGRQRVFLRRDDELLKTVRHRPNEPLVSFFLILERSLQKTSWLSSVIIQAV